jgi:hypothetical protein
VYGDSAVIGDAYENRGSIRADHIGMVKFSSRGDSEYQKVLYAIEMLLERLREAELTAATQSVYIINNSAQRGPESFSAILKRAVGSCCAERGWSSSFS